MAELKVKGIFHENDTLDELLNRLGTQANTVKVGSQVYESYKQLGKDLRTKLGDEILNRTLVIAKTLIVSGGNKYAMFTGLAGDEYKKDIMGKIVGESEASHKGINTQQLVGRVTGECSVILHSDYLKLFEGIVISEALEKELQKVKARPIIVYPLGNFEFFWGDGNLFLDTFGQMIELKRESEII